MSVLNVLKERGFSNSHGALTWTLSRQNRAGSEGDQASAARLSWSVRLAIAAATQALRLRTQVRSLIEQ
jgi:hypothetical protein